MIEYGEWFDAMWKSLLYVCYFTVVFVGGGFIICSATVLAVEAFVLLWGLR